MSRIAKKPVKIPQGTIVVVENELLKVKGPKGEGIQVLHPAVQVRLEGDQLLFDSATNNESDKPLVGTYRSLCQNLITGVTNGFERKLELVGVGYRAQTQGKILNLSLGYSHPISYKIPDGITIETPTQTEVLVKGVDLQKVGQVAAEIRAFRPPEPYKGKGIKYANERILRKEAKKK